MGATGHGRLIRWVTLVSVAGAAVTVAESVSLHGRAVPQSRVYALLALCAAASELVPLVIPRRVATETVSTTFIVAMLVTFGVVPTLVVMGPVIAISDLIERKPPWKLAFNVAQYSIAISAAGLVLSGVRSEGMWSTATVSAMLLAGLTFSAINAAVVDVALALNDGVAVLGYLVDSLPRQLASDAVLVAQAPVLVAAAGRSLWLVPLVGLPAAVVLLTARQSVDLRVQSRRTVETLAAAVDRRDPYTYDHSARVGWYAANLAAALGLGRQAVNEVESAGLVHDLGKIGVPDAVLLKPGALDEGEWCLMHEHPVIGEDLLRHLDLYTGVRRVVRHHHERFDGAGYPDGLSGTDIPIGSRIVAVADTFDAMTTDRPYRRGLPIQAALDEIRRCAGRQFDPVVAETFCRMVEQRPDVVRPHVGPVVQPHPQEIAVH